VCVWIFPLGDVFSVHLCDSILYRLIPQCSYT